MIVVTAKSGVGVGTEKSFKYLRDQKLPAMFYISKFDEENADFFKAAQGLRETFGQKV